MDRLSPYGGEMGMTRKARREVGATRKARREVGATRKARREVGATRRARHDGGLRAAWLTKVKRGESGHVPLRMVREARRRIRIRNQTDV